MANPFVHALVFVAAVLVPGGLLVYFAWRVSKLKRTADHAAAIKDPMDIPGDNVRTPTPAIARAAFEMRFPKESLHAREVRRKRDRSRAFRHRKYKN